MLNFLFVTTANLASNPRLLKELQLVKLNDYSATVFMFRLGNWSDSYTSKLMLDFPQVEFVILSATRKPFLAWFLSSILEFVYSRTPILMLNGSKLSISIGKRSWLLERALHQKMGHFDWVIAHNPASFYPAFKIAKNCNAKFLALM